jgi:lysophospholipase L1-like esterase
VLDRPQIGIVFDTLGINGARISTLREWDETHWSDQLKRRAPDLVVLAYGTNESADDAPLEAYSRQWATGLGRIRRAVPSAGCLIVSPPDRAVETDTTWATPQRLKDIIAMEERVADAAGCAFLNLQMAMGGDGTIAHWAEEEVPRAQKDRTHYTRESYETLGTLQVTELLSAYDGWKKTTPVPSAPSSQAASSSTVSGVGTTVETMPAVTRAYPR